jgi:hypothetical protein
MLGGIGECQLTGDSAGFCGATGLIQSRWRRGVEISHYHPDDLGVRKIDLPSRFHLGRAVGLAALLGNLDLPPAAPGWDNPEQLRCPRATVFISIVSGGSRAGKGRRGAGIKGTGLAAKQSCGRFGSSGSAYQSRTSALGPTKSGLTVGRHQRCCGHGLRSFFLVPGARFHPIPPPLPGVRFSGRPATASSNACVRPVARCRPERLKRPPDGHPTSAAGRAADALSGRQEDPLRRTVGGGGGL